MVFIEFWGNPNNIILVSKQTDVQKRQKIDINMKNLSAFDKILWLVIDTYIFSFKKQLLKRKSSIYYNTDFCSWTSISFWTYFKQLFRFVLYFIEEIQIPYEVWV